MQFLQELNIPIILHEHAPLFTAEQALTLAAHIPGAHCKNLFLMDENHTPWLVSLNTSAQLEKRAPLKQVATAIGVKRLRFATPEELYHYIGVTPGSVTPLGIINDTANAVTLLLDADFLLHKQISMHPLENTSTVTLSREDFMRFITACGQHGCFIDFDTLAVQKKI